MQTITFVFKCSNSNILEGAVGSKALCARRSWVIVMCSVGETFYSSGISPRLWNNWLFILEYSLVLAAIYLVNRSLKHFDLSDLSGVGRNILVYSRIILFFFISSVLIVRFVIYVCLYMGVNRIRPGSPRGWK